MTLILLFSLSDEVFDELIKREAEVFKLNELNAILTLKVAKLNQSIYKYQYDQFESNRITQVLHGEITRLKRRYAVSTIAKKLFKHHDDDDHYEEQPHLTGLGVLSNSLTGLQLISGYATENTDDDHDNDHVHNNDHVRDADDANNLTASDVRCAGTNACWCRICFDTYIDRPWTGHASDCDGAIQCCCKKYIDEVNASIKKQFSTSRSTMV